MNLPNNASPEPFTALRASPFADPAHPPLVAILRGLQADEAPAIGSALYDAGFRLLEVPLNRPGALAALRALRGALPADAHLGAGTVLTLEHVTELAEAGGTLAISPHFDAAVVQASVARGLWSMPGVATPSEAFAALRAGAHALKAFPNDAVPPSALKAWRSVLPHTPIFPVGGVGLHNLAEYRAAGASGAGLGSALYRPGDAPALVGERARALVQAWAAGTPD
jgi:2-dehydro-3-deoxyphosphogalactonate aldolase